jgi:4-hydroxy-4-methyl-2-oxoglutarate aldolase
MSQHVVIREIERADPGLIERLGDAGTATVHEAMGRIGFVGPQICPIQTGAKIGGSAITVSSHPGDNIMIHAAIEMCQPGDIMVVSHTAPTTHGEFGDLLATSLLARGVVGFITDGGVRDTADIREMGLPVWTQHVSCQGTEKNTPGSVNVPIVLGGITIMPGDVICADDDGVVMVERERAAWAVEATEGRLSKETGTRAKLKAGELSVDFYNLREKLIGLGAEYVDRR